MLAKVIVYGAKRWVALTRFLDDGRLEIDNNIAERSLRGIAVGRRHWLFAGSRVGGERAAAICTVIETCKMNGVDPQAYIADIIAKIAADWPEAGLGGTHAAELATASRACQTGGMTDQIAQIRITLDDIEPVIWRRVELPLSNSLKTLHLAIQAVMLFQNYHLFRFDIGEASYGIRFNDDDMDPITRDAGNLRLAKLIERGITGFTYTYDFGDDWRHSIVIEEVLPAYTTADYPRFIDGQRRAPPEDIGGPPGFEAFLDAMAKPRHPEHKSVLQWYGRTVSVFCGPPCF